MLVGNSTAVGVNRTCNNVMRWAMLRGKAIIPDVGF